MVAREVIIASHSQHQLFGLQLQVNCRSSVISFWLLLWTSDSGNCFSFTWNRWSSLRLLLDDVRWMNLSSFCFRSPEHPIQFDFHILKTVETVTGASTPARKIQFLSLQFLIKNTTPSPFLIPVSCCCVPCLGVNNITRNHQRNKSNISSNAHSVRNNRLRRAISEFVATENLHLFEHCWM